VAGEYQEEALMSFRETLQVIVENVGGGVGAVIMGYDGIPIDEYVQESDALDVQLLTAEYAAVLKEIKRTVAVLKSGVLEEVAINTEFSTAIFRVINEDFFIVLVMTSDGNFGKGRFLLKREAPRLCEYLQ
jgi:predicted regulator of Ras-like GTPase activity (Roadblock/LC7/MglB family)